MEKPILKNQKGLAIAVALIMLIVLTLLGLGAVSTTTFETNIASNQRIYNAAFYAADSGIEDFRATPIAQQLNPKSNMPVGDSNCTYSLVFTEIGDKTEGFSSTDPYQPSTLPPKFYKVTSVGIAPNLPVAGRVTIESVIEK